jgi:hypothetical protein
MRILVDRFIYQGLRYGPSRHAVCDQAMRGELQDQDEKDSVKFSNQADSWLTPRASGLASGLTLAARSGGAAEAQALKGGSRRSFLRSDQKGSPGALDARGAAPDNARRSRSDPVTFSWRPSAYPEILRVTNCAVARPDSCHWV